MKIKSAWFILFGLVLAILLSGCQPKGQATADETAPDDQEAATDHPLSGKKIALIMQQNLGTFSAQYIAGVEEQVAKFGGSVTVFTSDGDLAKMASNLDASINQGFDAILIDHGTKEALNQGVERAVEQDIPVVAFDAGVDVDGVVSLEQGDQLMAELTLEKLAADHDGEANIVKIWTAGFAPMERRQVAYEQFLADNPGIQEVTAFGAATQNTALDTQAQMEAVLKQYPEEGEITAVWAAWDEFAKGAVRAIEQAGRTDIKVYSIDMSDEDLQMIQKDGSPWAASAAVNPEDIGRIQVRYAYQLIGGETPEEQVTLEPIFIDADKLPETAVTTEQLGEYIEGWGASEQGYTPALEELEGR